MDKSFKPGVPIQAHGGDLFFDDSKNLADGSRDERVGVMFEAVAFGHMDVEELVPAGQEGLQFAGGGVGKTKRRNARRCMPTGGGSAASGAGG